MLIALRNRLARSDRSPSSNLFILAMASLRNESNSWAAYWEAGGQKESEENGRYIRGLPSGRSVGIIPLVAAMNSSEVARSFSIVVIGAPFQCVSDFL